MENTGFKKGQIVYVSDNGKNWKVSHYAGASNYLVTDHPHIVSCYYTEAVKGVTRDRHVYCLSVEDYHKMLNQPKDKDLVWAWDGDDYVNRLVGFYDAINRGVFVSTHRRARVHEYDNYEVIPREQWPEWAVEAYELLED